uniref:Uncharacterized protein n=1 Tax=Zea mays TaxID=4577 RepID=C4J082_MAIZE|nr:unknown [Zea mays]
MQFEERLLHMLRTYNKNCRKIQNHFLSTRYSTVILEIPNHLGNNQLPISEKFSLYVIIQLSWTKVKLMLCTVQML